MAKFTVGEPEFTVGDRVQVDRRHWLRPHAVGQIIEIDDNKGDHCYLIRFRERFTGGGIQGESLWLPAHQLQRLGSRNVDETSTPKAS